MFFLCVLALTLAGAFPLAAQDAAPNAETLKQADDLDWIGQFRQEKELLLGDLPKAATPAEQAEFQWRISRATLNIGDSGLKDKVLTNEQALNIFEEGESWADKAIKSNPSLAEAYFWKSANIGVWGQTKGVLDSLFKAGPMHDTLKIVLKYDPDYADAFYVLGELYEKVPGFISFGNVEYAVSLGRKAIDVMEPQIASGKLRGRNYSAYIALANHLWARNWDAARRASAKAGQLRQYNERKAYLEKNFFYEGTLTLKPISDRDEARQITASVIHELEGIAKPSASNVSDLKVARETAANFK
ncbi:MAG: hypothetical protein JXD23_14120 [Spirochaetales bacterium]|nr:hypothetical protein [Spirochaetales bacterium]